MKGCYWSLREFLPVNDFKLPGFLHECSENRVISYPYNPLFLFPPSTHAVGNKLMNIRQKRVTMGITSKVINMTREQMELLILISLAIVVIQGLRILTWSWEGNVWARNEIEHTWDIKIVLWKNEWSGELVSKLVKSEYGTTWFIGSRAIVEWLFWSAFKVDERHSTNPQAIYKNKNSQTLS